MMYVVVFVAGMVTTWLGQKLLWGYLSADLNDPDSFARRTRQRALTKLSDARFASLANDVDDEGMRRGI